MKIKSYSNKVNEISYAYLFISPFFILFSIFQLYPLVWSFVLSFYSWNGLGEKTFIGIGNYIQILNDEMFWKSMSNTALYTIVNVVVVIALAFIQGQLLCSDNLYFRKTTKTLLVLPYVTATVAAGIIFTMLFDMRIGVVNDLLVKLGVQRIPWLISMEWSKIPVMILSIWRNTPWYMLIMMSAFLSIDIHLYEAARIDGANTWQRAISITLPMVAPVLFFCLINITIDSARLFTEPFILTNGGPGSSSLSVVQYLYLNAFTMFKLGYASTIGYVLTFFLVIVSLAYFRNLKKQSGI
ncbi:MAG: sugar ABC transporter permease [Bacilli bacterium]|nr:sugar ABC transporter permease [Sphaerochaetaceae bacterium]